MIRVFPRRPGISPELPEVSLPKDGLPMKEPVPDEINASRIHPENLPVSFHLQHKDCFKIAGNHLSCQMELLFVWPHNNHVVHVPDVVFHAS